MRYPAHVVGGLTFGLATNQYVLQQLPIMESQDTPALLMSSLFIAGSVFGSLLPDIDHRGSYLGRRLPLLSLITNATLGHRGATHAPFVTFGLTAITSLLTALVHYFIDGNSLIYYLLFIVGCMIGALSHIFLDALTKSGVPLFYPFSSKHYRFAKFKSGGIGDFLVTIVMIIFIIWMVTGSFKTNFLS